MSEPIEILLAVRHVVVQDFPSRDAPDALAKAGLVVTIYGGPGEDDVTVSNVVDGEVVHRRVGRYPDSADLLCTYRPRDELDSIIAEARRLGARTVWRQLGPGEQVAADSDLWRERIERAGLTYVDTPPIAEVARALGR